MSPLALSLVGNYWHFMIYADISAAAAADVAAAAISTMWRGCAARAWACSAKQIEHIICELAATDNGADAYTVFRRRWWRKRRQTAQSTRQMMLVLCVHLCTPRTSWSTGPPVQHVLDSVCTMAVGDGGSPRLCLSTAGWGACARIKVMTCLAY